MNTEAETGLTGLLKKTHALGGTLEALRHWREQPHVIPVPEAELASLAETLEDLESRLRQFQAEPALLTVILMGGTGVGKSTLLNALAGSRIVETSMVRPTTQHPIVFHHKGVSLDRLDPALRRCQAIAHDRSELRHMILVDTPDMDGCILEHRQRLKEILPLADAVLYVGSQEKYHDRAGWELLLEHRSSRGFAFVLNKWDRCLAYKNEETGRSPEEDFRASLAEAGFDSPLIFRTCAVQRAQQRSSGGAEEDHQISDDFFDLQQWLDAGLDQRAIQDIKSRGISGVFTKLIAELDHIVPPPWRDRTASLRREWEVALRESVADQAEMLVRSADRHQAALVQHFGRLGRGNFRGIFGYYLGLLDWLSRSRFTMLPSFAASGESKIEDLSVRCVSQIPKHARQAERELLGKRLLALADRRGWPIESLETFLPEEEADSLGEHNLITNLSTELSELEREFLEPSGGKLAARIAVKGLCDWLPLVVVVILGVKLIYEIIVEFQFFDGLTALVILEAITLVGLHVLLKVTIPIHWGDLRGRLLKMVEDQMLQQAIPMYAKTLKSFTEKVEEQRASLLSPLKVLRHMRDQFRLAEQSGGQDSLFARSRSDRNHRA